MPTTYTLEGGNWAQYRIASTNQHPTSTHGHQVEYKEEYSTGIELSHGPTNAEVFLYSFLGRTRRWTRPSRRPHCRAWTEVRARTTRRPPPRRRPSLRAPRTAWKTGRMGKNSINQQGFFFFFGKFRRRARSRGTHALRVDTRPQQKLGHSQHGGNRARQSRTRASRKRCRQTPHLKTRVGIISTNQIASTNQHP